MPKVKICGNTNLEDTMLGAELGADYLGFIFAESKRGISLEAARNIRKEMKGFNNFVGVFYNQPKQEVEQIIEKLDIRMLQFHGDETALYCHHFMEKGYQVMKTFHVKDAMSLKRLGEYDVSAFLFDTWSSHGKGGTGLTFDWDLIEDNQYVHDCLFLAGGLNVNNLAAAIKKIKPFAVDVASGVEKSPGTKDPELLRRFIQIAKEGQTEDAPTTSLHK